ncbi:MAG: hypothetical protein JSW71_10545 [Gemmatimonadota bacterium]|nr:MAG: hypothetical protein JSW71_10545 [Gemmatimonadota bacterium]
MNRFRSRYARLLLAPVMAVSMLSACHHWKVQELAPAHVVTEKQPDRVRLTMLDGSRIEITDPMISDGQIVGHPVHEGYSVGSDTLRVPEP